MQHQYGSRFGKWLQTRQQSDSCVTTASYVEQSSGGRSCDNRTDVRTVCVTSSSGNSTETRVCTYVSVYVSTSDHFTDRYRGGRARLPGEGIGTRGLERCGTGASERYRIAYK